MGVSCTRLDHLTGSTRSDTLATDLSYTGVGVEARGALQAPSARLVPGYVAMCSTWPHASAQRPFVVARVAGWGLPLIPGQVFISKGRGRAKKREREKDKQKKEGGGVEEKKVNLCCQLLEKHQGLFSLCKEKEEKRGKGR